MFTSMTSISSSSKKLMHISINNSLSSVSLHIGNPDDDENRIQMLVDTGATMNSESLEYHLWIMYQCPEMMEEYLQWAKCTTYDDIHILAVFDLKDRN